MTSWSPWIAVALLFGLIASDRAMDQFATPDELLPPNASLSSLPTELDGWSGTDTELDDRLFKQIGAVEVVNRTYRKSAAPPVSLHCAYWDGTDWTPHLPTICYPGAGWTLLGRESVRAESHPEFALELCTFERHRQRVLVLYWYQVGRDVYVTDDQARSARRTLWGQSKWPVTFKVLMQAPPGAKADLLAVADRVLDWSLDLWPADTSQPDTTEQQ